MFTVASEPITWLAVCALSGVECVGFKSKGISAFDPWHTSYSLRQAGTDPGPCDVLPVCFNRLRGLTVSLYRPFSLARALSFSLLSSLVQLTDYLILSITHALDSAFLFRFPSSLSLSLTPTFSFFR